MKFQMICVLIYNKSMSDQQQKELRERLIELKEEEEKYGKLKMVGGREEESDEDEDSLVRMRNELDDLKKEIKEKRRVRRANHKVFVGTGFGFDITEFFKFKKKKELQSGGDAKSIFDEISGGHLSIIILIYSVCNAAMIPPWIMHIEANKLLRISWRFLLQTLMIIPFVLYEYRTANAETLSKYTLSHIVRPEHLKKAYISSFSTTVWFTVILTTFEWTYISHAMFLGSLANFFLSRGRTARGNGHDLEPGGQLLIMIGILLIFADTWTLRVDSVDENAYSYINHFYLTRSRLSRILGDLAAIGVSYFMSKMSVFTADLRSHYPPYLSMLLVNSMIAINMTVSAFYFNGATFDFHSFYGIFSIISHKHFAGFLYMSIILCMGLVISFVLVSKLFPNPIVPSLAMTFEPAMSTLLLAVSGVQVLPGPFSFIGYIFMIPGTFLILIGQWIFQRQHKKEELEQKQRLTQLIIESQEKEKSLLSKRASSSKTIEIEMENLKDYNQIKVRKTNSKNEYAIMRKDVKRTNTMKVGESDLDSPVKVSHPPESEMDMRKKFVSFQEVDLQECLEKAEIKSEGNIDPKNNDV